MHVLKSKYKKKLLRDLSNDIRLKDYTFAFENCRLLCISKTNGTHSIFFFTNSNLNGYDEMLESTIENLCKLSEFFESARNELKEIDYETLILNIDVDRQKETPIDCTCFYEKNGRFYLFSVYGDFFYEPYKDDAHVYITPDILEAHGVDIETFFNDVAECYMKYDGIDILDDSNYTLF